MLLGCCLGVAWVLLGCCLSVAWVLRVVWVLLGCCVERRHSGWVFSFYAPLLSFGEAYAAVLAYLCLVPLIFSSLPALNGAQGLDFLFLCPALFFLRGIRSCSCLPVPRSPDFPISYCSERGTGAGFSLSMPHLANIDSLRCH